MHKSYFIAGGQMRACFAAESQASNSTSMSLWNSPEPFGQPVLTQHTRGSGARALPPSSKTKGQELNIE